MCRGSVLAGAYGSQPRLMRVAFVSFSKTLAFTPYISEDLAVSVCVEDAVQEGLSICCLFKLPQKACSCRLLRQIDVSSPPRNRSERNGKGQAGDPLSFGRVFAGDTTYLAPSSGCVGGLRDEVRTAHQQSSTHILHSSPIYIDIGKLRASALEHPFNWARTRRALEASFQT